MKTGPKQMTLGQANTWLTQLRNHNQQLYERFCRGLETWEKDQQDRLCFEKLEDLIRNEGNLVKAINAYIDEEAHFKPRQSVEEFMIELRRYNINSFNQALKKLGELKEEGVSDDNRIIEELLQTFIDEPYLHNKIKQLLPTVREREQAPPPVKKSKPKPPPIASYEPYYEKRRRYDELTEDEARQRQPAQPVVVNPIEQMFRFRKLEPVIGAQNYESLIKILYLYEVGVLSRAQAIGLLPEKPFPSAEIFQQIKDSIETREADRRRTTNVFKPLTELNYSEAERTGYSYVTLPAFYPTYCSGKSKNPELHKILNVKWVIVPIGSQHPNFSIRPKNPFEQPLLRSEDQRYQFDLKLNKYRQSCKLLQRLLKAKDEKQAETLLGQVISMGVIQLIYKNASKQQKEEIEVGLKSHRNAMATVLLNRIKHQTHELQNFRQSTALKLWHDVAEKNFDKALDRRSIYFKHSEKDINKASAIIEALDTVKPQASPSIFNTFEGLSRVQYVHHKHTPDLGLGSHPFNPFLVMYYENQEMLGVMQYMLNEYIDVQPNAADKNAVRRLFDEFVFPLLRQKQVLAKVQLQDYDYERQLKEMEGTLPIKVEPSTGISYRIDEAVDAVDYETVEEEEVEKQQEKSREKIMTKDSQLPYKPHASTASKIFYSSQSLYSIFRLFYFLYQKVVRAYELCHTFPEESTYGRTGLPRQRFRLFLYIFVSNLRSKQFSKLEQSYRLLFGETSYVFFWIVKLFEGLFKAAQAAINEPFSMELIKEFRENQEIEEVYLLQVNQLGIIFNNSGRLIRMAVRSNGLVFFNSLESIYRSWFTEKKDAKEIPNFQRVANRMQAYLYNRKTLLLHPSEDLRRKNETLTIKNQQEYTVIPRTLQFISKGQDVFLRRKKQSTMTRKCYQKEVKKVLKWREFLRDNLQDEAAIGQL